MWQRMGSPPFVPFFVPLSSRAHILSHSENLFANLDRSSQIIKVLLVMLILNELPTAVIAEIIMNGLIPPPRALSRRSRATVVRSYRWRSRPTGGDCFRSVNLGTPANMLSFDLASQSLLTDAGAMFIGDLFPPAPIATVASTAMSDDVQNVRYLSSKDLLRLPVDCRPGSSAVSGFNVEIGLLREGPKGEEEEKSNFIPSFNRPYPCYGVHKRAV
ncbi:hypothetical protein F4824DRAFT_474039 [Ustulina deusta]|nr:hypothetical protein F4824DRAFT_474039 [Ustulina deusta]